MTSRVFCNLIGLHSMLQRQCIALYQAFSSREKAWLREATHIMYARSGARRAYNKAALALYSTLAQRIAKRRIILL